ncbi:MAG: hypothetical protein R3F61_02910 [Myxococcota bacterium]
MSHPTPWQLELFALGEEVPEVRAHLPCPRCEDDLHTLTTDPGPVPLVIATALRPEAAPVGAGATGAALGAAGVGMAVIVGALVVWGLWAAEAPDVGAVPDDPEAPSVPVPVSDPDAEPVDGPDAGSIAGAPVSVGSLKGRVAEVTGGRLRGHATNPVWSADGRHLAYEVNDDGTLAELWVADVGQGRIGRTSSVNLPGGGGPFGGTQLAIAPVWHPSGILVFEGSNTGGTFRLYYFQPGGGAASEMISADDVPGDLTFPAISARGDQMVFVSEASGHDDLLIRDTNTGAITNVVASPEAEQFPSFTPDGDALVFTRRIPGSGEDVLRRSLRRGDEVVVADGEGDQTRPVAVDDGVVFFDGGPEGDAWEIRFAGADGEVVLAEGVRLPLRARPAVSPDGAWVAYALEDPAQSEDLWFARVDGSDRVRVPTGRFAVGEPALTERDEGLDVAFTALATRDADVRTLHVARVDLE